VSKTSTRKQTAIEWEKALDHFKRTDPVLANIARGLKKGERLVSRGEPFFTLARSIVGQQISVKAADAVWARFTAEAPGPCPSTILALDDDCLRAVGLSRQKVRYLRELAIWWNATPGLETRLTTESDEEIIRILVERPGIGRWTAEMFLIFTLMRPDVFPVDDLGVLKAIALHYPGVDTKAKARSLAEDWRPYRTVATWLLWRSLDPVPVEY
jgi:DNA-3-methyladenine glycosylase II